MGHLRNINIDDESITMLLKDGKKHMIIREVMNLMLSSSQVTTPRSGAGAAGGEPARSASQSPRMAGCTCAAGATKMCRRSRRYLRCC